MDGKNKIVVITGFARGIGKALQEGFEKEGATVTGIDIRPNTHFTGDLADPAVIEKFSDQVLERYGRVDVLINNAMAASGGLETAGYEEFLQALRVGAAAPYELTRRFQHAFAKDAVVVNISSTRDRMSQSDTECYSAAKGAIGALTRAMSITLRGRARVVSVSPGWIETGDTEYVGADALQHPAGRVGTPADIVEAVLFLCSSRASFITGADLTVDGGMTKQMM